MNISKFNYILIALSSLYFSSCGDINVNNKEPGPLVEYTSKSSFCTVPPKEIGTYTKVLFVVDQSGSNNTTDPGKTRRRNAMTKFYQAHSDNNYIQWGFISFQEATATPFIEFGYFQNGIAFQAALTRFSTTIDAGGTPYKAAITKVGDAIDSDIAAGIAAGDETEPNYEIIFLSDGVPTDYDNPINDGNIFADITKLLKKAEGRLHFSTVYYNVSGLADIQASERLKQMAEVGLGKFQDASNGEDIDIDELITGGTSKESYQIKDLFVYNLNSTLCDDGTIGVDSDADGICDIDEDRYNIIYKSLLDGNVNYAQKRFDKYNRNSLSDYYSDLFILKNLLGEALPSCTRIESVTDIDKDLLNECEEKFLTNNNPQGPTQNWTNGMMTSPKYASKTNFDSDGDGIIDSLEFFFFKEKGAALDYNSIYRKLFGETYYDLFKNHQSKIRPESSSPYNIDVKQIQKNDLGQNCYTFEQQNLPLYTTGAVNYSQTKNLDLVHAADENVVLIYYIMTTENDPESKGIMRYSYQKIKIDKSAKSLDLSEGRFDNVKGR